MERIRSTDVMRFLLPFLIMGHFPAALGVECYIGNDRAVEDGHHDEACLTAHTQDPCKCSSFQLGGVNVWKGGQQAPTARRVEEIVIGEDDEGMAAPFYCPEPCNSSIGIEKGYVPGISITDFNTSEEVPQARPNQPGCVSTDASPLIRVDLGRVVNVSGLVLQVDHRLPGRLVSRSHGNEEDSVDLKTVTLHYSNRSHDLTRAVLLEKDNDSLTDDITFMASNLIAARYLTISIQVGLCYRFEILGCQELCQRPLGLSDGFIPDHDIHLLDSEVFDFGPEKARPVSPGMEDDGRPWCAGEQGVWIQVHVTHKTAVSGIIVTSVSGYQAPSAIVVTYIDYWTRAASWSTYQEISIPGHGDTIHFEHPFVTDVVRLYPRAAPGTDVCMRFELLGAPCCDNGLGMDSIPDSAFTASSWANATTGPQFGRLESTGWCARDNDSSSWISVDLGKFFVVKGVKTQGVRCDSCQRTVTRFSVEYMNRSGNWISVGQDVYRNSDPSVVGTNYFPQLVSAKNIRIIPTEWNIAACLRFELIGSKESIDPLGMENHAISDEMITASSSKVIETDPINSLRLGRPEQVHGGMRSPSRGGDQEIRPWVIIDLGQPTVVSGITLFCNACRGSYVLEHSVNLPDWAYLVEDGNRTVILQPDHDREVIFFFRRAVFAKCVRISSMRHPMESTGYHFPQLELWGCRGHCTDKLGVEDGSVPDSGLAASSLLGYAPSEAGLVTARLNHGSSWSPRSDDPKPWLRVNIGTPTQVAGVVTQGGWIRDASNVKIEQWVETFTASYSHANDATVPLRIITDDSGAVQIFAGNFDGNTTMKNIFKEGVTAMVLQILPLTWHGGISMRFELLGCKLICQEKLGIEDGRIEDEQLYTYSTWNQNTHGAQRARLNSRAQPQYGLAGGWLADTSPWLQVKFTRWTKVTGIVTQGRQDKSQWVTRFKVMYSKNWYTRYVNSSSSNNEFWGNYDKYHPVTNYFLHGVVARAVEIYPIDWYGAPSMRLELLGCKVLCQSQLGMEDRIIPDTAITASQNLLDSGFEPAHIRPLTTWWTGDEEISYDHYVTGSWIQVDLGQPTRVSGVILHQLTYRTFNDSAFMLKYTELKSNNGTDEWLEVRKSRTCQSWSFDGYLLAGVYELDIDGYGRGEPPFLAYCQISTPFWGETSTTLHHDAESNVLLETTGGTVFKDIHYNISLGQIVSVINSSSRCYQYVNVVCGPTDDDAALNSNISQPVRWVNRKGELMSNWGVPTGTVGCQCGRRNDCSPDGLGECRCSIGLQRTAGANDYGSLNDKNTLPVMKVVSDHPDANLEIQIGPLICYM